MKPAYKDMLYRRSGRSGLKLPGVSLGLWHNFGGVDTFENGRKMVRHAFELGITHFDLANNYGPPPGSAESNFGRILKLDFLGLRDRLLISTKAGYQMWDGPYQNGGSRKYLLSSLDNSLKRMGLDYVDIFYHHRPDPETPIEESMMALDQAVRSGKALYAGISNYNADQTREAATILKSLGTPCLIHQPVYNMFNRWIEDGLTDVLSEFGIGCIPFSPLAQGLLTPKYLGGIPADSRAANPHGFLRTDQVTEERVEKVRKLAEIADARGQSVTQLALAWILRLPAVTSVLIGTSHLAQLDENVAALQNLSFSYEELAVIENVLTDGE